MIFQHLVPLNTIGVSAPLSPVQGSFIVHDVERSIYAQVSASPLASTKVGYVPCTSDGFGGITQLARDVDCQYNSQVQTGYSSTISGTTLTVTFPAVSLMWNGVMQTLAAGSFSGTVSTGLWSLVVGYNWGLTQVSLVLTSALDPTANYIELCEIAVNTAGATATVTNGKTGLRLMQTLCVAGPASTAYSVPVSNSTGALSW